MRSKNLIIASVNVQDTSRSFVITLEPWQLNDESRRVAIYYDFTLNWHEDMVAEPKLFEMAKGFSPVSEFLSAKAFKNFKNWGLVSSSDDSSAQRNIEQMEKFSELRDAFSAHFPMMTMYELDDSPPKGVFGDSKDFRPLKEAKQIVTKDFFDRRI
jgi:hypothetical protein